MVARGRGCVINIGSVAGSYPYPGGNVYGASRRSSTSSACFAATCGTGVRVTVEPGWPAAPRFSTVGSATGSSRAVYAGLEALSPTSAETVHWVARSPPTSTST